MIRLEPLRLPEPPIPAVRVAPHVTTPPSEMPPDIWAGKPPEKASPRPYYGTSVELLIDGREAYPKLLDALKGAQREIFMEFYSVSLGETAREIAEILKEKAKQGIKVYFLYDMFGNHKRLKDPKFQAYFDDLRAAGVQAVQHGKWAAWPVVDSDHRKLAVIDGKTAFTGGINLGDHYRDKYHDAMIKVGGPAVAEMHLAFARNWHEATGKTLTPAAPPPYDGPYLTQVLATDKGQHPFKDALFHVLDTARSRVWIEMPYLTDDTLLDKLKKAAKRGVDVRLVVPEKTDEWPIQLLHRRSFPDLLKAGIKVHLYPQRMVHTKVAVADGKWAVVGSTNGTARALRTNDELSLAVHAPAFAREVEGRLFQTDFQQTRLLDEAYLKAHPVSLKDRVKARILEWFDFFF